MGIGSSREEASDYAGEASEAQEQLHRPMEKGKSRTDETKKTTGEPYKPMSGTRGAVEEHTKLHDKQIGVVEGSKKWNEEQDNPMMAMKKAMEEPKKPKELLTKAMLPYMYDAIIKEADKAPIGSNHIHSGLFLNNRKKKYWVDERTGHNCFMVLARGLLISWSEDQRYWSWQSIKETSDVEIDIASLLSVCWLEIHGRFDISYLNPGIVYEVVFVVMMLEYGYGWSIPVNLKLQLTDGSKQHNKEHLREKPRGKWIELKVGEFMTFPDKGGEIEFSLFEYEVGEWKRGIAIKGAIIRPKK